MVSGLCCFLHRGDLAPVQSQLVEDLSNFCDSCPMCQRGMLDSQSGFAETTDSERFREIQRDSERFRSNTSVGKNLHFICPFHIFS